MTTLMNTKRNVAKWHERSLGQRIDTHFERLKRCWCSFQRCMSHAKRLTRIRPASEGWSVLC